jgi:L-fuconolactonase
VLVQTQAGAAETADMLAVAAGDQVIAAVVGWVDLTSASVGDDLAAVVAGPGGDGLRGVRHQVQGEPDDRWLCRTDVLRGLRAVAAAGLRYDLLTLVHQLPAAIEAVDAVPELGFVLDHCSKPRPNRVMAGSDRPVCLLAGSYQRVLEATGDLLTGLTPHERDAVLGGTATRVYGLSEEPHA